MAILYISRHGESVANRNGFYQGQTYDTVLSQTGEEQANLLADFLLQYPIDMVVSSPLKRTVLTALSYAAKNNLPISIDKRIIETNHGLWEGLPREEVETKWSNLFEVWQQNPKAATFPQGETVLQMERRVIDWLADISKLDNNIAVFTHDNILRIVIRYIRNTPWGKFWNIPITNAGLTIIKAQPNLYEVNNLNLTKHLKNAIISTGKKAY